MTTRYEYQQRLKLRARDRDPQPLAQWFTAEAVALLVGCTRGQLRKLLDGGQGPFHLDPPYYARLLNKQKRPIVQRLFTERELGIIRRRLAENPKVLRGKREAARERWREVKRRKAEREGTAVPEKRRVMA